MKTEDKKNIIWPENGHPVWKKIIVESHLPEGLEPLREISKNLWWVWMPSVSEPFGIVPLEAMQADVPVIISNQSGVSEILKHAIKIDFWDTFAMADSIYGLLTYPALAGFLKKSGKQEVGGLKWHHSARHVQHVYKSLLNV